MTYRIVLGVAGLLLASCTSLPAPHIVISTSETAVPDRSAVKAGAPTIWPGLYRAGREHGLAGSGFVASTAQSGGLIIHDLEGAIVQRLTGPRLGDIDVAAFPLANSFTVVVGGIERVSGRTLIALFRLDMGDGQTTRRWAEVATDLSDPRGFCMRQGDGGVVMVAFDRRGEARQFTALEGAQGEPVFEETRRFRVADAGRGCTIDGSGNLLYFSHAQRGFWRYRLDPSAGEPPAWVGGSAPRAVRPGIDLAAVLANGHSYLASLDRDHAAISLWRAERGDMTWLGRFAVRDGPDGRRVRSLGGLDAYGSELEGFPDGLMVVQDQADDAGPNLKYVDWSAVLRAFGL
jgi:3-phytase